MKDLFDISKFDSYKEDNRREVKKANGGLPVSVWDSYSAFANCYGGVIFLVSQKIRMVPGILQDLKCRIKENS